MNITETLKKFDEEVNKIYPPSENNITLNRKDVEDFISQSILDILGGVEMEEKVNYVLKISPNTQIVGEWEWHAGYNQAVKDLREKLNKLKQ